MPASSHPIERLIELARQYRHVRGESDRSGAGSLRREHHAQLDDLRRQYETLLERWIPEPDAREQWRGFLEQGDTPPEDGLTRAPPVFVGRSDSGARLEVRDGGNGEYDLLVDGRRVDRMGRRLNLDHGPSTPVRILDQDWRETIEAPAPAVQAAREHLETGQGQPPWDRARELFADGLIDINFGLTPRGRRLLRPR